MDWIYLPEAWMALAALTSLEIVLGIDNIVFISILTARLPVAQQDRARKIGLALAMLMRIGLLMTLSVIMSLEKPWFTILGQAISGRDLILIGGGLFLIAKSTLEIHHQLDDHSRAKGHAGAASFFSVLTQIAILDMVFSLDSVITAVGMADHLAVMVIAIVISVLAMMIFVNAICRFVEQHPAFKILALSFLVLIGIALIGEGLELHIPKGYIYFAMAFSILVELLNLRIRKARAPKNHPTLPPPGE
jgi:predicted tellurium resistance membrane protein TerC